ncbi:SpoIIE family protein phosphatase [Streptomyces sp. R1]|uniref:PP2C family protein-serine/threonine phosphatase n=1 Tax=unclassified Streptomyces TaxID=2593676 RepID=UPI001E3642F7|nr:GAF domain-containing SpoIIE family protein phosphatase [Streptomyces sp. R1]MCC8338989.1 SpoIIE family protein phosphatase [Streptomyces sp. R1]
MDEYDVDEALQQALDRLTLLNEATTALAGTLDAVEGLQRVCRILVPQLADWCMADLLEDGGELRRVCVTHRDRDVSLTGVVGSLRGVPQEPSSPLSRVLSGAGPLLLSATELPPPDAVDALRARGLELLLRLGGESLIVAPLRARRQVLGALTVVRVGGSAPLTDADVALVDDLAHRMALALDNARLHQETQRIAERLQRSLLPELPRVHGLEIAARYAPAASTAEVGGDWYDCFRLPNGDTSLIVGDVTGHDLRAAVTMSQLRNMLRGIACDRQEPPGHILRRLDTATSVLYEHITASCTYALVKGPEGGPWGLHWARAGHPPPLLITYDGDTRYLEDAAGHGLLLGIDPQSERDSGLETLPHASTVLLYTDGLVERRGESLDQGLTRLRQHAAALAREPLDTMCDELVAGLAAGSGDDVALLALRLPVARFAGPVPGPARDRHDLIERTVR